VEKAIKKHLPQHQLEALMAAEESEREILQAFVRQYDE
jgi:hypothetical protein